MSKISFVIPCYRSEKTIEPVVKSIVSVYEQFDDYSDYEIILVNDCSPDQTFSAIEKICKENHKVIGINLSKNFGQHNAIMAGLNHVSGEVIVCLDDDGQTDPAEVPKLLKALHEGYDVVYARYPVKKHSFFRNFGSAVNELMAKWMLGKDKNLKLSSFFAMKRFISDQMISYEFPFPYLAGMILRITSNIANVEVEHRDRLSGESSYNFKKLMSLWVNGFTNFSVLPLRLFGFIGSIFSIIGAISAVFVIVRKFIYPNIPMGWTSTMVLILVVGGLNMLICSIIGEYVGRVFISLNRIPQYVIKQKLNYSEEDIEEDKNDKI